MSWWPVEWAWEWWIMAQPLPGSLPSLPIHQVHRMADSGFPSQCGPAFTLLALNIYDKNGKSLLFEPAETWCFQLQQLAYPDDI